MNHIELNYDEIESAIAALVTSLNSDIEDINSIYSQLAGNFTESSGEEADALRELQSAEKALMDTAKVTLAKFGESIRFAADEFKNMDSTGAMAMRGATGGNYK